MTEPATVPFDPEPGPIAPERAAAVLSIDLHALQRNWLELARRAAPAQCAGVVKGDAYGLGTRPCATALWAAGCRTFFVALPDEGAAVRHALPDATIYVLDGLLPGLAAYYCERRLRPVLSSPDEIEEWSAFASSRGERLAAALHVDTGINRLGLSEAQVEALAGRPDALDAVDVRLVMSHPACADEPGNAMNEQQRQRFDRLRRMLPPAPACFANSAAVFLDPAFAYDMVRPGVALYGGNPFASRSNPMSPVVHLYATILQMRELAPGDTVGYGATWRATRPSRVGVLGVGYRDGFHRAMQTSPTGPAQVYIAGHFAPMIGRISMDLVTLDLTDVPAEAAHRGARVELLGDHVTVDDMAHWAGTIPYEILTSLGSRFARLYASYDSRPSSP